MISTNQFKNGNHIEVEGTIFKILEFQHVKPGKGGAFVRTKLRRSADGAVIDRTFRAGEKFRAVRTEARKMQFLYADGTDAHFMDEQSYEQLAIPEASIADTLKWIKPNESVDLLFIDDEPSDVQLAASVELEVTHTEPGVRGDTASGGGNKPATLETGATDQGPAVRQHRRPGEGGHALGLVHVARVSRRVGPAPRRGLRALPARAHGPPARRRLRARRRSRSRGRSRTRRRTTRTSSTSHIARHAEGWTLDAHRAAGEGDHARRAARDAPSRPRRGRPADPGRGRDLRGRARPPRSSAPPRPPGFVNGILAAALRAARQNGAPHA